MSERERFLKQFDALNVENFQDFALALFQYQSKYNFIYKKYIDALNINIDAVQDIRKIPFLPIEFFKQHKIITHHDNIKKYEAIFESSGTSSRTTSQHFVPDLNHYLTNAQRIFEDHYGSLDDYVILALLPSYLEREGSSLVAMVDDFIKKTKSDDSGFYLYDLNKLVEKVKKLKKVNNGRKVIIWGVSFALLDLAENFQVDFSDCIIMETGGMKGRRKEITRDELHEILCAGLNVNKIHSEYGMTELLSQSYSKGNGVFQPSHSMKVLVREVNDPFDVKFSDKRSGGINVVDLANIDSCAFIETQDVGLVNSDGSFKVLGRFDYSDIRGCNLMVF
ncbi:acyltransferase [Marivirga tractuosa]|uniref:Acyl-protein synthetase, LuxE n=1 Tax=Marivirga tractuosa (strain ATCC 23168 / DSM 4126 / NBRC 15989 / NCIMB 1408 / VKM B-1430 / H-43) TaxID=643867 RepID=E4TTQ7_MARTH|nr:acyltransferase [Marivirga tractuosa]ADR20974.1 acyl-protein synthetase, LuxE [Marivirga tractuosa DSM 4126]BDD14573.1 acyltransferase [Marivirga tractuosa]